MKRLSLKVVKYFLRGECFYIRRNRIDYSFRLVEHCYGRSDRIIGYITLNQFMKLDLCNSLIGSVIFDYFKLRKECK